MVQLCLVIYTPNVQDKRYLWIVIVQLLWWTEATEIRLPQECWANRSTDPPF